MKILTCPLNGPRNIAEFTYGGQVKPMPNPAEATDQEWAHYVFYGDNHIGVVREWWMHTPSMRFVCVSGLPAAWPTLQARAKGTLMTSSRPTLIERR